MENRPPGKYTQLEMILAEEKAFAKFAAMRLANDDAISIPRIYFDMVAGDFPAAAVLDEILFWTLPNKKTGRTALRVRKDGILWLAVARAEWWERKRLTERQADRGIERLIELGLVEKSLHRYNGHAQMHLRVCGRQFFSLYGEALQKGYLEGLEDENPVRELADLYAMMGMSDSPNGDTDSPNGDTDSPNGETINIPQTSPNQPPESSLTPEEHFYLEKFVNAFGKFNDTHEADAILALFKAYGKTKMLEIFDWAFKKEIHLTNRSSLVDSIQTAAERWSGRKETKHDKRNTRRASTKPTPEVSEDDIQHALANLQRQSAGV